MERPEAALALGPAARGACYDLLARDEVASTNDVALACAKESGADRLWVVARRQTGGRGRHGRAWASAQGNLYASLILIDPCEVARAPELGFVTGTALFEAARALTGLGHPRLSLKWPNDLLVDGTKCAGILLEGHRLGNGAFALVIGVGVNVAAAPRDFAQAASLADLAPDATAERLFAFLSDEFARGFAEFAAATGADEAHFVRWARCAHGIGSQVRVKLPTGEVTGVFRGLERGRMVLDTEQGRRKLDAGDLYVMNGVEASLA
jgi:BirA family biotin operon repressor/biotin-[acetyl-CoA-carboxylase] ligase